MTTFDDLYAAAKDLPIIDWHNHLDSAALAADEPLGSLYATWVAPDPYKHRAMRICGEPERLITGDAPASKEKELAALGDLSGIDALVVGHHGSKSSSCEEFLSEMAGGKAIISVGKNNYGMPATEVLERLKSFGYTVFRTDMDGNVEIRIDG